MPRRLGAIGRIATEAWVARSLAGRGFDVLLAPLNFVPHLWRGRAVVVEHNLLALPSGSPYLTRRKAWYRIRALRSSLRRSQRVVAVSEYLRDRILAELPDSDPGKFVVIPLGLPSDWAERAARGRDGEPRARRRLALDLQADRPRDRGVRARRRSVARHASS